MATATARSSHHVHTAVVIASEEDEQSEVALHTAVNRAIAGAFAGSGEAAVANNIIDTTHRLQFWDSACQKMPDIANSKLLILSDTSVDTSFFLTRMPKQKLTLFILYYCSKRILTN